ncbi:Down syndrome cell adhesion molecule-like protein 1 [Chamberlinius hualienensis]
MHFRSPGFIILVITGFAFILLVNASKGDTSLKFIKEPPGRVDFAHTKGVQIECVAEGNPNPTIEWFTSDGSLVLPVSGLRDIQSSGRILNFYPFTPDKYRLDVHSAVYRCQASNSAGKIRSHDASVNGVVLQNYDIQVYDTFAIEGNTAVFKCHIPSVLADYVKVNAWIKNDNLLIQPAINGSADEKYAIMPTGELNIRDVTKSNSGSKYRCKTIHKLTGEIRDSLTAGQLKVTTSHGTVPPRILDSYSSISVMMGHDAVLGCVAQGNPPPTISWYAKSPLGHLTDLPSGSRFIQTRNYLLIKNSQISDGGIYVCEVVNEMGKEQLDITLTIHQPLTVNIRPIIQRVKLNEPVVFKCNVNGFPSASILWFHNGVVMNEWKNRNQMIIDSVGMGHRGMYQCIVSNGFDFITAVAELQLSEIAPYFSDTFKEVNLQSGENIVLKCVASGIPQPTITWKLDETIVSNGPRIKVESKTESTGKVFSSLKVFDVAVEDGGLYSCIAKSNSGHSVHAARMNVFGPLGKRNMQQKLGIAGGYITLNCPIYGYPIGTITWKKDDKALPSNLNQNILTNGSFEIYDMNKLEDAGIYVCNVQRGLEDTVEAQVKLDIMVPPNIVPFEFQEELLREGMRARLQCVVSEGDLPLNVFWLKDGKSFSDNLGVLVRNLDDYSILPKIIPFAFLDDQFYKGMRAHVSCAVSQGDAPVVFEWLKDGKPINFNLGVVTRKIESNIDSLSIDNVGSQHSGNYSCIARNRAGAAIHTAELLVRVPPKIVPFHFVGDHYEGSPARVVCGLQEGDAPIHFSWLHDGVPLKELDSLNVHEIDGLSSILSIAKLSAAHKGNYTCIAKNGAGADRHETVLHVHGDHVFEGALARLTCVVYQGDLPLAITWQKDHASISNGFGVSTHLVDTYTSVLTIDKVEQKHQGNYTCLAQNMAASASHTAQLLVNVPPRWIEKPNSTSSLTGHDVIFHCKAYGFPEPKITWMQSNEIRRDGVRKELSNSENIYIFDNGTLLIRHVSVADRGYYFCKVSNDVGRELSTVVQLQLHSPPTFKDVTTRVAVAVGKDAQIQCIVQGDPPMKIVWYKGDNILQEDQSRIRMQTTNTATDATSVLSIYKTVKDDQDVYTCNADNKFGNNKTSIKLLIKGFPKAPFDLKSLSIESNAVELSWKITKDPEDPIKKYIIQYKQEQDSWEQGVSVETVNGEPMSAIINKLQAATNYLLRIYAQNDVGKSPVSHILRVITLEAAPSASPVKIQVESVNTETFKVMWQAPVEKYWNGKLQGFYVGYKEVDTNDPYLFKTLLTPNPSADDLYVQIGGLKQFTKYAVVVLAYNSQGKGPESEPVIVMTSEGAPSLPPIDVRCTILTSQSIHITWNAPSSDSVNGILRGYKVLYKPVSDWFDDLAENFNVTLSTALTVSYMEKFTNYSIQVLGMTKAGDGPRSNPVFCKTLDDVPCPPSDIKAIATSDDSVIVSWKPPECPNGIIRSYSIYWKVANESKAALSHVVASREDCFEVTSLKRGKGYEFSVSASTMAGEGKPTRKILQTPNGPKVAAKVVSFDEKVTTPWKSDISLPCQAVGLPEPRRKWMLNGQSLERNAKAKISNDGSLFISGLEDNEGGDYSCHVQNDIGEDKITYTIIVLAPPSAPVTELTSVTFNSVDIQWNVPVSYILNWRRETGEWKEITVGSDLRSYSLKNLDCGTKYEIYLTAFNKIGQGQPSEFIIASTNGSVATAPSKNDLIEESSNSVSLYLNTWKSNGCPILYYMVEYATKNNNDWTFVSNNVKPEQRRLVVRDLRPATWFSLRMTAHNSAGSSVAEYVFATLTESGGTVAPDLQADSTTDRDVGILPYLNLYVVIPIACTVVILLAIGGVAWFYIKIKTRSGNGGSGESQMGTINSRITSLGRGINNSNNFAYAQQRAVKGRSRVNLRDDDVAPYATLQLAHQGSFDFRNRASSIPPPLPPPRLQTGNRNTQMFAPTSSSFLQHPQINQGMETTFVFPNMQMNAGKQFISGYPQENAFGNPI